MTSAAATRWPTSPGCAGRTATKASCLFGVIILSMSTLAACGSEPVPTTTSRGAAATATSPSLPSDIPLASDLSPATKIAVLPSPVGEIVFDARTQTIWADAIAESTPVLLGVSAKNGRLIRDVELPGDADIGVTHHLRISPDGSVWITRGYRVSRLEVATGRLESLRLSDDAPGRLPAATDANGPQPGTWISAIAFTGTGDALLARNSVTSLTRLSPQLTTIGHIPVPGDVPGPSDMVLADRVLTMQPSHVAASSSWVTARFKAAGPRLSEVGGVMLRGSAGSSQQLYMRSLSGASVSWDARGSLSWRAGDERQVTVDLPYEDKQTEGPSGVASTVRMTPQISGAVVANDSLWFVAEWNGATGLYRIDADAR